MKQSTRTDFAAFTYISIEKIAPQEYHGTKFITCKNYEYLSVFAL